MQVNQEGGRRMIMAHKIAHQYLEHIVVNINCHDSTPPGQETRIGTFSNIGFIADDMEKTYHTLTERGVEFEKPPKKQSRGTSAVFNDLDGNTLALSSK